MNVSFIEAHNILSKMEQGEAIFRPSSKVSENNNNNNIIIIIIIIMSIGFWSIDTDLEG